jgi:uncharacterized membrane protein YfcA
MAVRMDAASLLWLALAAFIAGGVASIVGFGIGSILTPVLAIWIDAKLAVAAISIPHLAGTALRFWMLNGLVDRRVLWSFGVASAAGGLAGALVHTVFTSPVLLTVLAVLLLFVAAGELLGFSRQLVFRGAAAWIAGAASGLLGGLVGNQGGLRSAALLGFRMNRDTFIATATAIGLFVDAARMPVYFAVYAEQLRAIALPIVVATAGVIAGTLFGNRVLRRIPESSFRRVVAVLLLILGLAILMR